MKTAVTYDFSTLSLPAAPGFSLYIQKSIWDAEAEPTPPFPIANKCQLPVWTFSLDQTL